MPTDLTPDQWQALDQAERRWSARLSGQTPGQPRVLRLILVGGHLADAGPDDRHPALLALIWRTDGGRYAVEPSEAVPGRGMRARHHTSYHRTPSLAMRAARRRLAAIPSPGVSDAD